MQLVSQLLAAKSDCTVHGIAPTASVFEAMQQMADRRIGALLVVDGARVLGIVTERDYARKVVLRSRASKETSVEEIMSTPVVHVRPDQSTDDCMMLMARHQLRHLPVIDGGELVGMVSIRDLVDEIVADRRLLIDQLEAAMEAKARSAPPTPA